MLINSGADVNAKNVTGSTPLHLCALNGKDKAAKVLVEKGGADLRQVDEEGLNPLHTACTLGALPTVECLIALGADVLAGVGTSGNTPCHVAARAGHLAVVEKLLEKGGVDAVLKATNNAQQQPLHRAAAHGQKEIVTALVKSGADIAAVDSNADTALHLAAMFGMSEVRFESAMSMVYRFCVIQMSYRLRYNECGASV